MICEKCIHYEFITTEASSYCLCSNAFNLKEKLRHDPTAKCEHFKDKSRFVELPCKVGDKYWKLKAKCTMEGRRDEFDCYVYECENCCQICDKQIYIEECIYKNAWDILNIHKKEKEEINICNSMRWIFTNKEEAEAKLKELKENENALY